LIAAGLLAIVTFAAPGEALARRVAHQRGAENDRSHTVADARDVGFAVSSPDHDHQRALVPESARPRVEARSLLAALAAHEPEALVVGIAQGAPVGRAPLMHGDPQAGRLPRLRAPPAR
jgi:phage terminase large subunit-like protein